MKKRRRKLKKRRVLIVILAVMCFVFILKKSINSISTMSVFSDKESGTDQTSPVIELDSEKVIVAKGNDFKIMASAKDDIDGDLTDKIVLEGKVDTSTIGTYNIKYSVSDSSGNKAEKSQTVEVRDKLENGLPVLMYHFFYEKSDPNYIGKTPDNNILLIDNFEEQMAYLKEENFYFPTWQEVEDYIDGKINLPEKSVVITDDDGNISFFVLAVPVIEEYQVPITSFIITSMYEERLDEKYAFVNYQSHSDDMHKSGSDGKGAMVNWSYDDIVNDLKVSKNKIESHTKNSCTVFCYPFGHYNDTAKNALKDSGYHFAFTTQGGRVKPQDDKFELSRVRVNGSTTIDQFKNLVK